MSLPVDVATAVTKLDNEELEEFLKRAKILVERTDHNTVLWGYDEKHTADIKKEHAYYLELIAAVNEELLKRLGG